MYVMGCSGCSYVMIIVGRFVRCRNDCMLGNGKPHNTSAVLAPTVIMSFVNTASFRCHPPGIRQLFVVIYHKALKLYHGFKYSQYL